MYAITNMYIPTLDKILIPLVATLPNLITVQNIHMQCIVLIMTFDMILVFYLTSVSKSDVIFGRGVINIATVPVHGCTKL